MHTHSDTLKILGCSKMTLSRYVKAGKLNKIKRGRKSYYDETEVALLVKEVEENKRKAGVEIKPKEKIELPPSAENEIQELSADTVLNKVGMATLREASKNLIDLGLYEECDKQILLCYALATQAYNHYFVRSIEVDSVTFAESGSATVHPYHRIMMDHQKMMSSYADKLGLNPLARLKFDIQEKEELDEMEVLLNE